MCPRLRVPVILLAATLIVLPSLVTAGTDRHLLGRLEDDEIRERLAPLLEQALAMDGAGEHEALFLLSEDFFDISRTRYEVRTNLAWLAREADVDELETFEWAFPNGQEVEEIVAFVLPAVGGTRAGLLASPVERLDDDRIDIHDSGRGRVGEVVVAFPNLEPGQVYGLSVRTSFRGRLGFQPVQLAKPYPIAEARVRLKAHRSMRYSLMGQRLAKGSYQRQILDEKKGHTRDQIIAVRDVPALTDEPYGPPEGMQGPQLIAVHRADWYDNGQWKGWMATESWSEAAYYLSMVEVVFNGEGEDELEEYIGGLGPVASDPDALYLELRDNLQDRHSTRFGDDDSMRGVLRARSGSLDQKAWLMARILSEAGQQARVVWAHEPSYGKVHQNLPQPGQFPWPMVLVERDGQGFLYDLGCGSCHPGRARPELFGEPYLEFARNLAGSWQSDFEEVAIDAWNRTRSFVDVFQERARLGDWCRFNNVPGGDGVGGYMVYHLKVDEAEGEVLRGELWLDGLGQSAARRARNRADDAEGFVQSHLQARLPSLRSIEVLEDLDVSADTLRARYAIELDALPGPTGDRWVVPAALLFGDPCLPEWPELRETPVHVLRNEITDWIVELPAPEGFRPRIDPVDVDAGVLAYKLVSGIEDGKLKILRRLEERRGERSGRDDIAPVAQLFRWVHEAEGGALVLERAAGR